MRISKFKTTLNPNFTSSVTFMRSILRTVLSMIQEQMTLEDVIPLDFTYKQLGHRGKKKIPG